MNGIRKMAGKVVARRTAVVLIAVASTCVSAQSATTTLEDSVTNRFPRGSIRSTTDAEAALTAVARERANIEARYATDEQACHPKFFTTSCIDQAKDRRRAALSELRPVEIEANTFKRQARVSERDKELAERLEKSERERRERESMLTVPGDGMVPSDSKESSNKMRSAETRDRQASHVDRMRQQRAEEAAMAGQRAANVAAYDRKKRESLERQQKVAQRKAEKEEKRKAKQGGSSTSKPE